MQVIRYSLNPNVVFILAEGRKIRSVTEYDKMEPYASIYKLAIENLQPEETGEFELIFVRKVG
jgi:hypothetical protein